MSFVEHIPRPGGEPYLTRYRLLVTPLIRVYLHRIYAPDGACMHDHPWAWWASIVLWGGYTELIQTSLTLAQVTRLAGSVAFHGTGYVHMIDRLHPTRSTWTLLVVGPHVRRWGFFTRSGWIDHRRYSESRDC